MMDNHISMKFHFESFYENSWCLQCLVWAGQGSRLLYSFSLNQVWGQRPQKWLGMKWKSYHSHQWQWWWWWCWQWWCWWRWWRWRWWGREAILGWISDGAGSRVGLIESLYTAMMMMMTMMRTMMVMMMMMITPPGPLCSDFQVCF